jgi:hypothetical protein
MKTRKHRKWYQLNGMLSAGKFDSIVESPFAIFYICPEALELKTVVTGDCVVFSRKGFALDKKTAAITANYPEHRLCVWAGIHPEDVESVRQQLSKQFNGVNYRFHGNAAQLRISGDLQ